MTFTGPGKSHRLGLSTKQFFKMFPDDAAAEKWFIRNRWPDGICCPRCGSTNVNTEHKHKTMPFRCRDCRKPFSTKTGTPMQASNLGYLDWMYAIYLLVTNLKSVSSMKLHRELEITQKSAWHLAHRIRKGWASQSQDQFDGPVEADETYFGGKRRNMPKSKRAKLEGRGPVGKTAVVGVKDRTTKKVSAKVVTDTTSETLQGFVLDHSRPGAKLYTDDATAYESLPNHESVKHSLQEYVKGDCHTNGVESFWSMLKRAHRGTFHRLSPKHLHRYLDEFVGRHSMRELGTPKQMGLVVQMMAGKRLRYKDLVA